MIVASSICHEDYPNLILRTSVVAIEKFMSEFGQRRTQSSEEEAIQKIWSDGVAAYRDFDSHGSLQNLDLAISKFETLVEMTPGADSSLPDILKNLGTFLNCRFERLRVVTDVHNAIERLEMAIGLIPDGDPRKSGYLSSLGLSLQSRFDRLGNLPDLHSAITRFQSAIDLTPDGHPDKPGHLNNLGISLQRRFERLGDVSDLDSAITQLQLVVNLTPEGQPSKPGYLNNLGTSLQRRFERLGDVSNLDRAITQLQLAVNLIPDGHPTRLISLTNLGSVFTARFRHLHHAQDAEAAITHLSASAQSPVGSPTVRLLATQKWIFIASLSGHHSLMSAYEYAVGLMPVVAWLGLPIQNRHEYLVQISRIARDAAAAAISLEQYDTALEWLEQGRSIVWNQILQLRTPVDRLREVNSDLADRFLEASRLLDRGFEKKGNLGSTKQDAQQYRALVMEWESILKDIRSLPNFKDFLKPLKASQLRDAAQNGPVVVVNIAEKRCDALALIPGLDEVIHIALPDVTYKRMAELQDELKNHLYSNGIRMREERAAQKWTDDGDSNDCRVILAELWNGLAKPVLESLGFSVRFV
jgi:tetratricopeptide (TPR) repeat protein